MGSFVWVPTRRTVTNNELKKKSNMLNESFTNIGNLIIIYYDPNFEKKFVLT